MSTTPLLCLIPNRMLYLSLVISTASTPTSSLLWRAPLPSCALIDNHSNQGIITSVFHKKTYTGLLTNYFSFVPVSYKLGLVCTLVDRIFIINNTWAGFQLDLHANKLTKTLRRNLFPSSVIEHVVRKFINNGYFTRDSSRSVALRTIVCILNYRTSVLFPS